jgi:XRE family transcriptional regulator of biofilm formation
MMQRFGEKLRNLRTQHGLTLTELGDMFGVSHSYIGKMERGERLPNVTMLVKVADMFKVCLDKLVRDEFDL